MVMIEGALITGGICLSYWLDFGFRFLEPSEISWRFPIAFQLIFGLIIIAFILELPESPRWLVMKGKEDEALSVLSALNDRGSDDPVILAEISEIKDTVLEMSKGSFRDLFTTGKFAKPILFDAQLLILQTRRRGKPPSSSNYSRLCQPNVSTDLWYQSDHLLRRQHLRKRDPS